MTQKRMTSIVDSAGLNVGSVNLKLNDLPYEYKLLQHILTVCVPGHLLACGKYVFNDMLIAFLATVVSVVDSGHRNIP